MPQPPQPVPGQQPVNPGAPFNLNNPQNNAQGGNNALGFIGRYMGLPQRPANQPPNRQAVQNILQNHGQANGHAPGIVINYQVQYQFPRPNNDNNGAPQQRLPVPTYAGFPGPGGVWQPWPAEGPAPVVPTPGNAEGSAAAQPQVNPEVIQQSTSSTSAVPSSLTTTTVSTSSDLPGSPEQAEAPSAREAAAKAALSRFNSNRNEASASKVVTATPTTTSNPSSSTSANPTSTSESSSSTHADPASNPEPPRPPENTSRNKHIPTLIPLFDFRQGVAPRVAAEQSNGNAMNSTLPHYTRPASRVPMPSRSAQNSTPNLPMPNIFGHQQQAGFFNISASQLLPPTLTDEQLAALDAVTRESIDERLRILEGVSASVYRCIDDLMRLRSALPPVNTTAAPSNNGAVPVPTPSTTIPQPTTQDREGETTTNARGKEKMREPSAEESDPGSSIQSEDSSPSV